MTDVMTKTVGRSPPSSTSRTAQGLPSTRTRPAAAGADVRPGRCPRRRDGPPQEAVARVRIVPGSGQWTINDRTLEDYFPNKIHQQHVNEPFGVAGVVGSYDVIAASTAAAVRPGRRAAAGRCPLPQRGRHRGVAPAEHDPRRSSSGARRPASRKARKAPPVQQALILVAGRPPSLLGRASSLVVLDRRTRSKRGVGETNGWGRPPQPTAQPE